MLVDHGTIGILAGILGFIGFIPYMAGTIRGKLKPNRATWFIWAAVNILIAASYGVAGATDTIWIALGDAAAISIVAVLSIRFGQKGWTTLDKVCLCGAGIGILVWLLTSNPVYAYVIATLVDGIGLVPTLVKAYGSPMAERSLMWPIFMAASALTLLAITEWTPTIVLFPAYLFVSSIVMSALIYLPGGRPEGKAAKAGGRTRG